MHQSQKQPAPQAGQQTPVGAGISRDAAMGSALGHYRAGRLVEAGRIYQAVLASNPRDADALHLLGVVRDAEGDAAAACELIGQALAIREMPSYRSNLGMFLGHLGRHAQALECYERALALRPDYPEALNNLGVSLDALRRTAEAETAYRRAVALRPDYGEAWGNLGNALRTLGRTEEAACAWERAVAYNPATPRAPLGHALRALGRGEQAQAAFRHDVERDPDSPAALNGLAVVLGEASQHEEAALLLSRAADRWPAQPEAYANLGLVLSQLGRLEEAVAACERALELRPDYPEALINLGNAQRSLGRLAESETALRRVLALRPTDVGCYNNLAITLQGQDRPHEALAVLDLAAALQPDDAETHHHRAMLLLRHGHLAQGWKSYEWRFRTRQAGDSYAQFAGQARWHGEPLDGRTILLVPEQGLGDTIQFARYAPMVAAAGGRVVFGVQKPLARLLAGLPGVSQFVAVGEALPPYDLHCPLLSLPAAFGTTLETIPAAMPYLHPEPRAVARWALRLRSEQPGLRVGLVWAGNPRHLGDRQRSLDFTLLAPLLEIASVRWFSLQVGARAADLSQAPGIEDLAPDLTDFAETAAAIDGLDLVITVDTAVAHVAGAIGRPVWLLLPATPDWRWLRSGAASPWYPGMRLFRQDGRRCWSPVIEDVGRALHAGRGEKTGKGFALDPLGPSCGARCRVTAPNPDS